MTLKICTLCKEDLPLTAFGPQKTGRDGRKSRCKACLSTQGSAYYAANRDDVRVRASARNAADPQPNRDRVKTWRKENPQARWGEKRRRKGPAKGFHWNVFYVVRSEDHVKFGTTSHLDDRLSAHQRDGFGMHLRIVEGLPDGAGLWTENQVKSVLSDAGAVPAWGKEYFDLVHLDLILTATDRLTP